MTDPLHLVIVGMGSGGMPAADLACRMGLRVALVERHRVGGDCLWTGCVPSKALLASAKVAHHLRTADRWGLPAIDVPAIDTQRVWDRIKEVQQRIAETDDDPDRYRELGAEVVFGDARLVDGTTVQVGDRRLEARHVLLCTGSRPALPPVPGLAEADPLTSERFFELERCPSSMLVVGGGPIAIEVAQACHRLGIRVVVVQRGERILPRDEPALADRLAEVLRGEGLDLRLRAEPTLVEVLPDGRKAVTVRHDGEGGREERIEVDAVFVAAGRRPNVEGLGLEELGIGVTERGVEVDDRGRTSVPTVYAAGDVAGRNLFTHAAAYEAVRAVRDMFLPGQGKVTATIPWCTFTDPELAHLGLTEAEARERFGDEDVQVHRMGLDHSDRARADGTDEGAIVVVTGPRGKIVGAHILSASAGELVHELALAEKEGLALTKLASLVHVYPTLATSIGQLAAEAVFDKAARLRQYTKKLDPVTSFVERLTGR